MTNYEWLLKEHEELVKECMISPESVAVDSNGNVDECGNITCNNCIFGKLKPCYDEQRDWLNAEYNPYTIPLDTPIDAKVLVSDCGTYWSHRHFAGFSGNNDCPYTTYDNGMTSWSAGQRDVTNWSYCKLAEKGEEE